MRLGICLDVSETGFDTVGQKFLRGYQTPEENGAVQFRMVATDECSRYPANSLFLGLMYLNTAVSNSWLRSVANTKKRPEPPFTEKE